MFKNSEDWITDIEDFEPHVDEPISIAVELDDVELCNEALPATPMTGKDIKPYIKKPFIGYRKKIEGYPLDHEIQCSKCKVIRKVGYKQIMCPCCGEILTRPQDVGILR